MKTELAEAVHADYIANVNAIQTSIMQQLDSLLQAF